MHFPFRCPQCGAESAVEYSDSGIHDFGCRCGQNYALYLRQHKFETLFDFGTRALSDGYAREATANFAGALERCFEFYLRAVVLERGRVQGGDWQPALDATWKQVDRQSERQLGAFALVYLLRQGAPPSFLTPQALGSDFRNRVVHRGYIPGRAEAMRYAESVFGVIDQVLRALGAASVYAQQEQEALYAAHRAKLPDSVRTVELDLPGLFRVWRFTGGPQTPSSVSGSLKRVNGSPSANLPDAPNNDAAKFNFGTGFQARLRETDIRRLFAQSPTEPPDQA